MEELRKEGNKLWLKGYRGEITEIENSDTEEWKLLQKLLHSDLAVSFLSFLTKMTRLSTK